MRRRATDQARDVPTGARGVTRVDPLGGESEVEVTAGDQARELQLDSEWARGCAGERRRLKYDELSGSQRAPDGLSCREHRSKIRVLRMGDRCWDAHHHGVQLRKRTLGLGRANEPDAAPQGATQPRVVDVIDRRVSGLQLGHSVWIGVDADDVEAGFVVSERQRQSNVAEPNHADASVFLHPFSFEFRVAVALWKSASPQGAIRRGATLP